MAKGRCVGDHKSQTRDKPLSHTDTHQGGRHSTSGWLALTQVPSRTETTPFFGSNLRKLT